MFEFKRAHAHLLYSGRQGFTLIELMVVAALVVVLLGVGAQMFLNSSRSQVGLENRNAAFQHGILVAEFAKKYQTEICDEANGVVPLVSPSGVPFPSDADLCAQMDPAIPCTLLGTTYPTNAGSAAKEICSQSAPAPGGTPLQCQLPNRSFSAVSLPAPPQKLAILGSLRAPANLMYKGAANEYYLPLQLPIIENVVTGRALPPIMPGTLKIVLDAARRRSSCAIVGNSSSGGPGPGVVADSSCPLGKVANGFVNGEVVCVDDAGGGGGASCPSGQTLISTVPNTDGTPNCTPACNPGDYLTTQTLDDGVTIEFLCAKPASENAANGESVVRMCRGVCL